MIELLVVIALIGMLAVGSAGAYLNTQKKARDARRKTDIETFRQAFELFKATNSQYPGFGGAAAGAGNNGSDSTENANFKNRISGNNFGGTGGPFLNPASYPADPISTQNYFYRRVSGTTYEVCTKLESPEAVNTCTGGGNCGSGACNFGLTQP